MPDVRDGGSTCDFKPHGNIGGFGGDDAHHVRHGVALHHGEGEGGLLEKQWRGICRQLRFGNPLDVQATSGGFLRAPIVDGFNLRKRQRMKRLCYTVLCNVLLQMSFCAALWRIRRLELFTSEYAGKFGCVAR